MCFFFVIFDFFFSCVFVSWYPLSFFVFLLLHDVLLLFSFYKSNHFLSQIQPGKQKHYWSRIRHQKVARANRFSVVHIHPHECTHVAILLCHNILMHPSASTWIPKSSKLRLVRLLFFNYFVWCVRFVLTIWMLCRYGTLLVKNATGNWLFWWVFWNFFKLMISFVLAPGYFHFSHRLCMTLLRSILQGDYVSVLPWRRWRMMCTAWHMLCGLRHISFNARAHLYTSVGALLVYDVAKHPSYDNVER